MALILNVFVPEHCKFSECSVYQNAGKRWHACTSVLINVESGRGSSFPQFDASILPAAVFA